MVQGEKLGSLEGVSSNQTGGSSYQLRVGGMESHGGGSISEERGKKPIDRGALMLLEIGFASLLITHASGKGGKSSHINTIEEGRD